MKNRQKHTGFLANIISFGGGIFSLSSRKYFSSTVNVLAHSPGISHLNKRGCFQPNLSQNDE